MLYIKDMNNSTPEPFRNDSLFLCDHSSAPFGDCYCQNVTGRTVPNIVLYCMGRYQECPVYRRRVQSVDAPDSLNGK